MWPSVKVSLDRDMSQTLVKECPRVVAASWHHFSILRQKNLRTRESLTPGNSGKATGGRSGGGTCEPWTLEEVPFQSLTLPAVPPWTWPLPPGE